MDEIWRVENGNAFIDARHPLEENDCSTAGTMIIPLDRGDWQGIKRAPPDSAAFSLRGPPHYPRVDRVEINGNDDNCPPPPPLDKRTVRGHNKILVTTTILPSREREREKSIPFTMKFYAEIPIVPADLEWNLY